jgi:hypothetical protein
VTPFALGFFIDTMKLIAGPDLLRVKGLVALTDEPDRPVVIQACRDPRRPASDPPD